MSIRQMLAKIKNRDQRTVETLFFCILLTLVGIGSFGLGILSERSRLQNSDTGPSLDGILITSDVALFGSTEAGAGTPELSGGNYFASRNGTTYYPLGCKAGERILYENKIYFQSTSEAELAGYKQSSSCTF